MEKHCWQLEVKGGGGWGGVECSEGCHQSGQLPGSADVNRVTTSVNVHYATSVWHWKRLGEHKGHASRVPIQSHCGKLPKASVRFAI